MLLCIGDAADAAADADAAAEATADAAPEKMRDSSRRYMSEMARFDLPVSSVDGCTISGQKARNVL